MKKNAAGGTVRPVFRRDLASPNISHRPRSFFAARDTKSSRGASLAARCNYGPPGRIGAAVDRSLNSNQSGDDVNGQGHDDDVEEEGQHPMGEHGAPEGVILNLHVRHLEGHADDK